MTLILLSRQQLRHIQLIERRYMDHVKRPIMFLDMAVPRDIDPAIDTLDHVHVITLDTLRNIASQHQLQRQRNGTSNKATYS